MLITEGDTVQVTSPTTAWRIHRVGLPDAHDSGWNELHANRWMLSCFMLFCVTTGISAQERSLGVSVSNNSEDGRVALDRPTKFTAVVKNRTNETITATLRWDVHTVAFLGRA